MIKSITSLVIMFTLWFGAFAFAGSHGESPTQGDTEQDVFPAVQVRIKIEIYTPDEGRKCVIENVMRSCATLGLGGYADIGVYSFTGEASAYKMYKIAPIIRKMPCVKSATTLKP